MEEKIYKLYNITTLITHQLRYRFLSSSTSSISSLSIKRISGTASLISSSVTSNGSWSRSSGLRNTVICCSRTFLPLSQGFPSLKQEISLSRLPSTGRLNAQHLNDFFIMSSGSSFHASITHFTTILRGTGFMFPASVNS